MTSEASSRSLVRGARLLEPRPHDTSQDDVRTNSQLLFYRNKCRVLEQDLTRLRDLVGIAAPENGAVLPSVDVIRRVLANKSPATAQEPAPCDDIVGATPYETLLHDYVSLQAKVKQMTGVMNSPPVRVARVFSGWGRQVKRAFRRSRKPTP